MFSALDVPGSVVLRSMHTTCCAAVLFVLVMQLPLLPLLAKVGAGGETCIGAGRMMGRAVRCAGLC
jgi:hypothetical protein